MEHVSTLCAISTVGIAATGFALGRVDREPTKSGRFRKKTFPLHDQCARSTDSPVSPLGDSVPQRPPKSFATAEDEPSQVNGNAAPSGGQPADSNGRRRSSLAGIILRRRGQTLSSPPPRVAEDPSTAKHTRRPSSSWVRRLSFQPESRSSCQSPVSPSFHGPASPVGFRPSGQRRAPNKLIKRPPSQHSHPLSPTSPTATSRPVTSYQRSEPFRHKATHSLNFEPGLVIEPPTQPPGTGSSSNNGAWQPYLSPSPDGLPDRLARRFSTATRPREYSLRRILPSIDTFPALLLGTSMTSKEPVTEVNQQKTTLASPVQFRDPFQPQSTPPQEPEPSLSPETKDRQRSLSGEADPKSSTPSEAPLEDREPRIAPLTQPKRRAISTPLPNFAKSEGTTVISRRTHERRNITDPNVFCRPSASSQTESSMPLTSGIMGPRRRFVPSYSRADLGYLRDTGQRPLTSDAVALSTFQGSLRQRAKRHSIAASDPASTVIGSDDTRIFTSGEEDETDFLSDTAFDSIRTHLTASDGSALHAPRIETIFDNDPPLEYADKEPLKFGDFISNGPFTPRPLETCPYDSHEDATPVPVSHPRSQDERYMQEEDSRLSFPSDLTDDEDSHSLVAALPGETNGKSAQSMHPVPSLNTHNDGSVRDFFFTHERPEMPLNLNESDSRSFTSEALDSCPKMNIFDWSEQPKSDREASGPDGRPRTVHGKHGPEARGSRAPGRKAPNTLHFRSQSVPVSRDPATSNEARQTSGKFGTWGLGSKGVSEDWDSDFDFEDTDESTISESIKPNKNVSRRGMIVPQTIMERQASLHGQFGQVQELTLLVEELKRLRHQASFLGIVRGPSNDLWKEAEGIVNLATLDDEDDNHSPPGSPSSLTFSFDDSEGDLSNTNDPLNRVSGDSWQPSLSEQPNPIQPASERVHDEISAKANSVLDLIYQQRVSPDPTFVDSPLPKSKKLPFNTQSLRDLVVRAGVVTRALKEVIRKAEGVATDPNDNMHNSNPPFSRIFNQPSNDNLSSFEARCVA